jgi:hypothetical protein
MLQIQSVSREAPVKTRGSALVVQIVWNETHDFLMNIQCDVTGAAVGAIAVIGFIRPACC